MNDAQTEKDSMTAQRPAEQGTDAAEQEQPTTSALLRPHPDTPIFNETWDALRDRLPTLANEEPAGSPETGDETEDDSDRGGGEQD
ncbi:hypothetical protein SAMN05421810_101111 [Amycolatopsis arida]|uniref:Uncharacterized protein n=1 Tax=Amycolatopsis arida TaxID=587909 RepID=A0A1I5KF76_9PSEU|nr:hypothetical protein [Amycolatopsis arida]TDX97007.1 hypothetical protein CLV69_102109 [Amycolatopsis arida]SFO83373.1 hypothetical protein SAMN05421810_101111 [Amycolatopsis arida]